MAILPGEQIRLLELRSMNRNYRKNSFKARYSSPCNQCGGWISRGETILRVGEQAYSHRTCGGNRTGRFTPGRGYAPTSSGGWRDQNALGWPS